MATGEGDANGLTTTGPATLQAMSPNSPQHVGPRLIACGSQLAQPPSPPMPHSRAQRATPDTRIAYSSIFRRAASGSRNASSPVGRASHGRPRLQWNTYGKTTGDVLGEAPDVFVREGDYPHGAIHRPADTTPLTAPGHRSVHWLRHPNTREGRIDHGCFRGRSSPTTGPHRRPGCHRAPYSQRDTQEYRLLTI